MNAPLSKFKGFITNEQDFDNLVKSLHDPDAERFRYFGAAMMAAFNAAPSAQSRTLQSIIAEHTPITLDDMRACIDAAMILTPLDKPYTCVDTATILTP